ncbi:squalene/phytoene synthase family protein [Streptomyces sp. NBC_00083]|uniref:phytoene/squalene synthase family protein n=1 Tax=Streptomyces sp. NBC_00083 TaxID=2975647 RepID=UPI002251FF37|nr:squalene/phytoene synthase family protein [Streptomyces sp. NBC_00083]MCX5384353.1 squalene/phytoene synthase family protein [Streptomyces sp. NBC_00083]
MRTWNTTLTVSGVHSPRLRQDYTTQRALVAGYRRQTYLAVRLLLPPTVVPHVVAAVAFMHHTDTLLDAPPADAVGEDTYDAWEAEVRRGLATGESGHPVLRPLLHTLTVHPSLRSPVERFLAGAPFDRDFTGFADEDEYQRYVDAYSLPAFMLVASLLFAPGGDREEAERACRSYIDGSQRLDFVCDLAEDLREGRLGLPEQTMKSHGVCREDLEQGRDTPGVRALLREMLTRARRDLLDSRVLPRLVAPPHRAFTRAFVTLEVLTADAATAAGTRVLREPASPSLPAALRVVAREYVRRGR